MLAVSSLSLGCQWDDAHQTVRPWPLRIVFESAGDEVTVDQMLKGLGHAIMQPKQLVELVRGKIGLDTPVLLISPPEQIEQLLLAAGYRVEVQRG